MTAPEGHADRMIAAQLLAYYFTELKDDQLKKVSDSSFKLLWWSFYIRLQSFVISQQPSVYPQTPANSGCMLGSNLWGLSCWEKRMHHLGVTGGESQHGV